MELFMSPLKKVTKPIVTRRARGRPPKSANNSLLNASIIDFSQSIDDGIGMSNDDSGSDIMNESIAGRIKTRPNRRKASNKAMDSRYLYDRVIENIINKYVDSDDENVDNDNKVVKGFNGKRTKANVRSRGVNDDNDDNDSVDTFIENVVSRGRRRTTTTRRETKTKKMTTSIKLASPSNSSVDHNYCRPKQNTSAKQLQLQSDRASTSSIDPLQNELVVKFENRKIWTDKGFQLACLNGMIEILAKRDATAFLLQMNLKKMAMKTLGLPILPSVANNFPIIQFDCKGQPKFEFYFLCEESPLHITERIKGYDQELFELTKIAYQMINEDIAFDPIDDNDSQNSVTVDDVRNAARKRITF